jgi:hypothetical protein
LPYPGRVAGALVRTFHAFCLKLVGALKASEPTVRRSLAMRVLFLMGSIRGGNDLSDVGNCQPQMLGLSYGGDLGKEHACWPPGRTRSPRW